MKRNKTQPVLGGSHKLKNNNNRPSTMDWLAERMIRGHETPLLNKIKERAIELKLHDIVRDIVKAKEEKNKEAAKRLARLILKTGDYTVNGVTIQPHAFLGKTNEERKKAKNS